MKNIEELAKTHLGKNAKRAIDLVQNHMPDHEYHNIGHVEHMARMLRCETIGPWRGLLTDDQITAVVLFVFFHDIVYDPTCTDNETQSFKLYQNKFAMKRGGEMRIPSRAHWIVKHAIDRSSRYDEEISEDTHVSYATHLCHDLDLEVLSWRDGAYSTYIKSIRKEYSHVEDELFLKGRQNFLMAMFGKANIYETRLPFFMDAEKQARSNIALELQCIRDIQSGTREIDHIYTQ